MEQPKRYDVLAVLKESRRRRKEILRLRNKGLKLREIGDLYGISRQRVSELVREAKRQAEGR